MLGLGLIAALVTGDRPQRLQAAMGMGLANQAAAAGFKLKAVHVEGASKMAQGDVLAAVHLYKDQPILGLDLEQLRADVEKVGWVKEAKVVRLLPDTLVVAVVQRDTLAVWQRGGRTVVIDGQGRVIPEADAGRFPQLPLIVGEGADVAAGGILPALVQRPRLMARLEALVRVDQRRWDVRLKDGSLIQLPAIDEEEALIRLDQLEQRQGILELGFERIDLREPGMVAVRPREAALAGQLVADGA